MFEIDPKFDALEDSDPGPFRDLVLEIKPKWWQRGLVGKTWFRISTSLLIASGVVCMLHCNPSDPSLPPPIFE